MPGEPHCAKSHPTSSRNFAASITGKLSTRKEMRWGSKGSFSLVIAGSKGRLVVRSRTGPRRRHHRVHQARARLLVCRGSRLCGAICIRNCGADIVVAAGIAAGATADSDDDDDEKRIEQALGIWCETRPLRGTLAETYLRSRCIEVPDEALEVLRFHPRCPWQGERRPATGRAGARHHHRRADRHPPHGTDGRRPQDRAQGCSA